MMRSRILSWCFELYSKTLANYTHFHVRQIFPPIILQLSVATASHMCFCNQAYPDKLIQWVIKLVVGKWLLNIVNVSGLA